MSKVSKNQRGVKQKPRVRHCPQGHELVTVLVVGTGFTLQCACTGYAPLNLSLPYESRKAAGFPGKATAPIRGGDARLVPA